MSAPNLSIVVPLFNEEESLPVLHREIATALEGYAPGWEVIYIDDGSTDASAAVLRELATADARVRVLRHRRNAGQSAGLVTGFAAARGQFVATLDADLQNDPADLPRLLEALEGWDAVSGVRAERHDNWVRRASSRIANRVRDLVIHDGITDVGCSLKVYRVELLRRIPKFKGMHRFLPALVQMEGGRVREAPVTHRARRFGVPKYNIGNRLWRGLADLAGVRWLKARHLPSDLAEELDPRTGDPKP